MLNPIVIRPFDTAPATPSIIQDGLLLHLDAGNASSYPGSGTTWSNLTGLTQYNAILNNGPTYDSGNGGSFLFDGNDDYVSFNTGPAPGTGAFTWNFWAKLNNVSTFSLLFSGEGSNASYGVIGLNPNSLGLAYYAFGYQITDGVAFGTSWTFVSFVGSGGADGARNLKLYRNGVQAGSTFTTNYNFTTTNPYIGRNHSAAFENMKGYVSKVTYYNRALSGAEMLENFNVDKARYGL